MAYYVKVNKEVNKAISLWCGYDAATGNDPRRLPVHHASFYVVNAKSLLSREVKMTASGKLNSRRAANMLEATVREIAARAGVTNITTFVA